MFLNWFVAFTMAAMLYLIIIFSKLFAIIYFMMTKIVLMVYLMMQESPAWRARLPLSTFKNNWISSG